MLPKTSESLWLENAAASFPKLTKAESYDAVIIGGGITGLMSAWLLKQAGKTVCVLERDSIGAGDTGYTTANLTMVTDDRLPELVKTFGKESATAVWQAGAVAIDLIEGIIDQQKIDCNFQRVPGYVHLPDDGDETQIEMLHKEFELAQELGFEAEFVQNVPLVNRPGIRFADQALFHPLKFLAGLAKAIEGNGCAIYEKSEAKEFDHKNKTVTVNDIKLTYDKLIIATHVPLMGNTGFVSATMFQTKLYPYSSYVVAGKVTATGLSNASFWDTADPYRYLRVQVDGDTARAIYGGEDHKTGQVNDQDERFRRLADSLVELIPGIEIDARWSGQVVETNDGLPYIGQIADNQFVATGYSGNGMTFGTCAALMAHDWVLDRENPWSDLFSVDRKKFRGGTWEYLKENLDVPYYFLADRLKWKRKDEPSNLANGQGNIFKIDGKNVACARDSDGKLHQVSAVCTHMGCLVRWNGSEQTWDCPCHGSRFHCDGRVLGGPAESPLDNLAKEALT
jgi:glycine/D-amino acid oxidase-like deaminating enzyme/nitrite reductase/ring-hydroxylating ferredoxin subunit